MKLNDILIPERVIFRLQATDRPGVLRELVRRGFFQEETKVDLEQSDEETIVSWLLERERLQSTGIKDGLAIPHTAVEGIDELVACVGLQSDGIAFGSLDKKPAQIFIVLLSPASARGSHLKALARISRLFADGRLQRRMMECASKEAIFEEMLNSDARL